MARARPVALRADMPFAEAAARVIEVRAEEMLEHAEGVLDVEDIERVHDMRVATRRLRAALEIFAPCLPRKERRAVLAEVKDLADALGARRDPDVHLEELGALAEHLGVADGEGVEELMAALRAEQAAGNRALAKALKRARKRDLGDRLRALAREAGR